MPETACLIYISYDQKDKLESLISGFFEANKPVVAEPSYCTVFKNNGYDLVHKTDKFVYYKYYLDIEFLDEKTFQLSLTALLYYLWSQDIKAVAVLENESLLPYSGGYKNGQNFQPDFETAASELHNFLKKMLSNKIIDRPAYKKLI